MHRTNNPARAASIASSTTPSDEETKVSTADTHQSVEVRINGEPRVIPAGLTVSELLTHLHISSSRVAVERNRAIVAKTNHEKTPVESGDEIEIVSFIGGG